MGFLFPTAWDRRQLETCRAAWSSRFDLTFLGPADDDVGSDLDVFALVEGLAGVHGEALHGVATSSDYPGAVAAALLAERLGLPGSPPKAVLALGHKAEARRLQAAAVPGAVPWVRYLDPRTPDALPDDLRFPCFVKPVRGSFSLLAREIPDRAALRRFLTHESVREHGRTYVAMHRALQGRLAPDAPDPGGFLAEGLLTGHQTTVEGWIADGRVELLGIVDSVMHPGTRAFARFETPSALPAGVQARMADVARRVALASGLVRSPFNVELIWDETSDALHVIEMNARLCGQFGDLWQKTLGMNGYEPALALAVGEAPLPATGAGPFRYAASIPLRTFAPVVVEGAPSPTRQAEVERAFPGTSVWWECRLGETLDGFDAAGEGQGYRYAVINVGAHTRKGLVERASAVEEALGARLAPLLAPDAARSGPASP